MSEQLIRARYPVYLMNGDGGIEHLAPSRVAVNYRYLAFLEQLERGVRLQHIHPQHTNTAVGHDPDGCTRCVANGLVFDALENLPPYDS